MRMASLGLGLLLSASAQAAPVSCSGTGCGADYISAGWTRVALCNDHNWSYVLRMGDELLFCEGVMGRAGPIEFPCQPFKGNLAGYIEMAKKPQDQRSGAECMLPAIGKAGN